MSRIARDSTVKQHILPIIGKIKVGQKTKISRKDGSVVEIPESLDYFVCNSNLGKYDDLFRKACGDKPNTLHITFPSDDIDFVCNERYEGRDRAGNLVAEGNGKEFTIYDENGSSIIMQASDSRFIELRRGLIFKERLTLRFLILEINSVYGVWELSTSGSRSSIPAIVSCFDSVMKSAGFIRCIPFDLTIKKTSSQKPGKKKNFPVLQLVCNIGKENLELLSSYQNNRDIFSSGIINNDKILMLKDTNE